MAVAETLVTQAIPETPVVAVAVAEAVLLLSFAAAEERITGALAVTAGLVVEVHLEVLEHPLLGPGLMAMRVLRAQREPVAPQGRQETQAALRLVCHKLFLGARLETVDRLEQAVAQVLAEIRAFHAMPLRRNIQPIHPRILGTQVVAELLVAGTDKKELVQILRADMQRAVAAQGFVIVVLPAIHHLSHVQRAVLAELRAAAPVFRVTLLAPELLVVGGMLATLLLMQLTLGAVVVGAHAAELETLGLLVIQGARLHHQPSIALALLLEVLIQFLLALLVVKFLFPGTHNEKRDAAQAG